MIRFFRFKSDINETDTYETATTKAEVVDAGKSRRYGSFMWRSKPKAKLLMKPLFQKIKRIYSLIHNQPNWKFQEILAYRYGYAIRGYFPWNRHIRSSVLIIYCYETNKCKIDDYNRKEISVEMHCISYTENTFTAYTKRIEDECCYKKQKWSK